MALGVYHSGSNVTVSAGGTDEAPITTDPLELYRYDEAILATSIPVTFEAIGIEVRRY
ncbi:hypothetical protein SAMN04487950_2888 [Halogranum rubrum]|uniref:Uncharacterized protein n=1 Tax=Halogranum rubrum TaxID=553466 RepID=A0A1I4FXI6_9EURY|nr:hypothetical protein [Halogranum rubrum]SFL22209.1 hypothetical protein SAMN04487950_2888 [Halogranum rubrum]